MKKSKLRNIIKESIKELMTEQTVQGTIVNLGSCCHSISFLGLPTAGCNGGNFGQHCREGNLQIGDIIEIPSPNPSSYPNPTGLWFVTGVGGPCSGVIGMSISPTITTNITPNPNPQPGCATLNNQPVSAPYCGTCPAACSVQSPGTNNWTHPGIPNPVIPQ